MENLNRRKLKQVVEEVLQMLAIHIRVGGVEEEFDNGLQQIHQFLVVTSARWVFEFYANSSNKPFIHRLNGLTRS